MGVKFKSLLIFPLLVASLQAASESDLRIDINSQLDGCIVSDCLSSASGSLDIPSTYYGLPVISIEFGAFENCSNLTSITIPKSVTSIVDRAFYNCSSLNSVVFEGDAPTFGTEVFAGSDPVTIYYDSNYSGWSSTVASRPAVQTNTLTYAINGDGTEYSVVDCLESASGSLDIPSTYNDLPVTSIGSAAFRDCTSLTYVTIPDSVTSIGAIVFEGCSSLDSITIPDGVTNIGYMAFYNCTSLSSVVIPDGVTRIEGLAFAVCTNLTNIIIPDSVIYLGYRAFGRCTSLENITIPASVTTIDGRAFHYCTSLNSVVFEGNAPTLGTEVFENIQASNILVKEAYAASYGGEGATYGGLLVTPLSLSLYNSLVAERDAALAAKTTVEAERDAALAERDARPTQADYDAVVAERDTRPTQAAYDAVIAERNARLTESEVRDLRLGSSMLEVVDGDASINIELEATDNLGITSPTWTPVPESKVIIHPNYQSGKIRIDVGADDASNSGVRFFRFKMTE